MGSFQAGKNRGELKKVGFTMTIRDGRTEGSPEEEEAAGQKQCVVSGERQSTGPARRAGRQRAGRPEGAIRPARQTLSLCCCGPAPRGDNKLVFGSFSRKVQTQGVCL